jgi:hypothetical protein
VSVPRFVPLTGISRGQVSTPVWPGGGEPFSGDVAQDGSWIAWRLLGANNRELGRSTTVFSSRQLCVESIRLLTGASRALTPSVIVDLNSGLWTWNVGILGRRLAVSGRGYARQRECRYTLGVFISGLQTATPDFTEGRWRSSGGAGRFADVWNDSDDDAAQDGPLLRIPREPDPAGSRDVDFCR